MKLSIIIPTLDEAAGIVATLLPLQPLRKIGHEVIVADGGSSDATLALATPLADHAFVAPRGRARQMNAGAAVAHGDVLVFLHADTLLPPRSDVLIADALIRTRRRWGHFGVRLSGAHPLLRIVEAAMNLRARLSGIATGDQTLFVEHALFKTASGFPPLPLMEDIALARVLKRHGAPLCLRAKVLTSSRRWETQGILRTVWLMWRLRLAYFCGADPERLVRRYYGRAP